MNKPCKTKGVTIFINFIVCNKPIFKYGFYK